MNKFSLAVSFFLPLIFFSCKTAKEAGETKRIKIAPEFLLEEIKKSAKEVEWFSGKAKVTYKDEKHSRNFTINIRMKKDSVIYASLTSVMGVEAAKILITPDSIFIIDRLNKVFYNEPFGYVSNYVPFPVDIQTLQDLITGPPILINGGKLQSKSEKGFSQLTIENGNMVNTLKVNPENYSLSTEHLVDKQSNRRLALIFSEYKTTDNSEFSHQREISFKGENEATMEIRFSRVKLNEPQTFPFFISDQYENRD